MPNWMDILKGSVERTYSVLNTSLENSSFDAKHAPSVNFWDAIQKKAEDRTFSDAASKYALPNPEEPGDENEPRFGGFGGADKLGEASKMIGGISTALAGALPHKGGDSTNETGQQAIGGAMLSSSNPYVQAAGAAFNALSMIGSVTGLNSNRLSNKQANKIGMSGGEKFANNLLSFIPLAGAFMGKTNDAYKSIEIDKVRDAYSGTADDIDTAGSLGGGRMLGRDKANRFIDEQNRRNRLLTDISKTNTLRKQNDFGLDLNRQNFKRYTGETYQNTAIGKQGMKLLSKEELARIYKNGGKADKRNLVSVALNIKSAAQNDPQDAIIANTNNLLASLQDGKLSNKELIDHLMNQEFDLNQRGKVEKVLYALQNLSEGAINMLSPESKAAISEILSGNITDDALQILYSDILDKTNIGKFQNGGSILIPEGSLHAHKHHMEDENPELAEELTEKGIPVIVTNENGEVEQVAEIEREEIILEKSLTQQIEELWKDGSEEAMIKAGKIITKTMFKNCDDNANLIERTE